MFTAISGALMSAVGGFYSAVGQRNELKSRALSADFEASMANLNARSAEQDAQAVLKAGQDETGQAEMRYGQLAGEQRASAGGSGTQIGVGSNAEVAASIALARDIDRMTITENTVRAAGAARLRSVNERNRGLLATVSASNLRASAKTIKPWLAATNSLFGSAGNIGGAVARGY